MAVWVARMAHFEEGIVAVLKSSQKSAKCSLSSRCPHASCGTPLTSDSHARNSSCFEYMSPSRRMPYLPHDAPDAVSRSVAAAAELPSRSLSALRCLCL